MTSTKNVQISEDLDNLGQDATGCRKRTYKCLSYTVHHFVSRKHFFITS